MALATRRGVDHASAASRATRGSMSELERWESRYSEPGYLFGTEPSVFLKSHAHLLRPGLTALAVADGEGRNGVFLAERGLDVLAIDISPTALAKAQALAKERGVALRTEVANLHDWTWPTGAFDAIIAIFIQFSMPNLRTRLFAGIKQALKPGGLLLLQGYRPEQIKYKTGGPSDPERLYTRALLEQAFADFSSLAIEEHDSVLSEGSHHIGTAALIDLVGRK
jgi:cyclopropane fatty-acyl-phospholipid synthase-like methyltransferase